MGKSSSGGKKLIFHMWNIGIYFTDKYMLSGCDTENISLPGHNMKFGSEWAKRTSHKLHIMSSRLIFFSINHIHIQMTCLSYKNAGFSLDKSYAIFPQILWFSPIFSSPWYFFPAILSAVVFFRNTTAGGKIPCLKIERD